MHTPCHIGDQERSGLISVQGYIAALPVGDLNSHSVAVRICRDQDVRADFAAQFLRQSKGFGILRIRIAHCSELRIRVLLLGNNIKILVTEIRRQLLHRDASRAVERSIDDRDRPVDLVIRALSHGHNVVEVRKVHLLAQHPDFSLLDGLFQRNPLKAVKEIKSQDLFEHSVGDLSGDLRAVHPVYFISVVFLRIVAGCHVDAAQCREASDGKRQLGRRTERREQVRLDPVSCQDLRRQLRELLGVVAAVIGKNKPPVHILP